jgi:hypothetical protein
MWYCMKPVSDDEVVEDNTSFFICLLIIESSKTSWGTLKLYLALVQVNTQ